MIITLPGNDADGEVIGFSQPSSPSHGTLTGFAGQIVGQVLNPAQALTDQFGSAVAVGTGVYVIGAPGDESGGVAGAGAAYVYDQVTGALLFTLANPALSSGDQFGASVAVAGNMIAVGAPLADPGGVSDAGAVYLFDRSTGTLV